MKLSFIAGLRAIIFCVIGVPCAHATEPRPVHVESTEQGQGVLMKRLDSCFLVTANHVVKDTALANVSSSYGTLRIGEGRVIARFPSQDIALLQVIGPISNECGGDWLSHKSDLSARLARRTVGTIPYVFPAGPNLTNIGRMQFSLVDLGPTFVRILPQQANDRIEQGQSGSILSISEPTGERPIGILLSVEEDKFGKALRWDQLLPLLETFFERGDGMVAADSKTIPSVVSAGSGPVFSEAENKLSLSTGATVHSFNRIRDPKHGSVTDLINTAARSSWRASLGSDPVEIVFKLPGEKPQVVSEFALLQDETSTDGRVKDMEILIGLDGIWWSSIKTISLLPQDNLKATRFIPSYALYIKLKIYSSWGRDLISLKSVYIK